MNDYPLIPTDPGALDAEMIAAYEALTGAVVRPGSPEMLFIKWVEGIVLQERALANYAVSQNLPSRAEGEHLDALGELFGVQPRPEAKAAACTGRFSISEAQSTAVLIPAGTRVTDAGKVLVWATEADAYVPIGETYVDLPLRCRTPGTVGNGYAAGQLNTLVDLYDYCAGCANITETGGGSDAATDAEYYALLRASMDAYSCAGARGSYIYWAKQVSTEIADVVANAPSAGSVKLYVLMEDGTPAGTEVKKAVMAACSADEVRPLTDLVSVEDPETVSYNITFTYYLQDGDARSAAELAAAVEEAVAAYMSWQSAKLGRDINPSRLIGMLMQAGVKRVVLTAPVFTALRDGGDGTVPQVAQRGAVTITNGGYESE